MPLTRVVERIRIMVGSEEVTSWLFDDGAVLSIAAYMVVTF